MIRSDFFDFLIYLPDPLNATGSILGLAAPPVNVFRKGDDYVLFAELPGISKADLNLQVKGRTIRLSGTKAVQYGERPACIAASALAGRFDRSVTCRSKSIPRA